MAVGIAITLVALTYRIGWFCLCTVARFVWCILRFALRLAVALMTILCGFCSAFGGWLARKYKAHHPRPSQARAAQA